MISVFGWPDPNTGFNQSEHALYTCYFIIIFDLQIKIILLQAARPWLLAFEYHHIYIEVEICDIDGLFFILFVSAQFPCKFYN